MKKFLFFTATVVILSACGGGGQKNRTAAQADEISLQTASEGIKNDVYQELIESIKNDNEDLFKERIKSVPNIDSLILFDNEDSYSLLGYACMYKNCRIARQLIKMKANMNAVHSDEIYEYDALEVAINSQDTCIVKLLLDSGASVDNTYNENGATSLTLACWLNNYAVAKMLIQKRAKVDGAGDLGGDYIQYPLLIAIQNGNAEIVKLLFDNGARINIADKEGNTPQIMAKKTGDAEIEKILEERIYSGDYERTEKGTKAKAIDQ